MPPPRTARSTPSTGRTAPRPEYYVTTQRTHRGTGRWAYAVHMPGAWPFVSDHRYHTEAAARKAGDRDLAELLDYLAQEEDR